MKIALVSQIRTGYQDWPIGLLSLVSYAQNKGRHEIEIIEADSGDPHEQLCARGRYDVIGISAQTINYEAATRLAEKLKESHPDSKIIIGGVHISTLPSSLRPCFDLAIPGEAEQKFVDYLEGNYDETKIYPRLSLEDYPALNYDAISPRYFQRRYLSLWNEFGVGGALLTSRGCPFRCVFCSTTRFWRGTSVKMFPLKWVVNEIKEQASRGITHLGIWDDLFTINKPRLRDLTQRLKAEGLNHLKLAILARASTIDDEMCGLLAGLNVGFVNFGFESGNERVLRWLKCGTTTVRDNVEAIKLCRKHGLAVVGSLIFPADASLQENMDTVRFALKAFNLGVDSLWHFPLYSFPGTPIWDKAEAEGRVSPTMNFNELGSYRNKNYRNIHWQVRASMLAIRILLRLRRLFRQRKTFLKSLSKF
jgi:radical SAM superfamily enzyme YgiQ (UPF0313 family)